jgi:hypothetical protein
VRLHWGTAYPEWRLQAVDSLNGAPPRPFQDVSTEPVIVNGRYSVIVSTTPPRRFHRLAK